MLFYQHMKKRQGLTLIEVIIVLAILMIVITATYSVFALGNRSFIVGNTQYDIQSDVRVVVGYVENQVKYATNLSLINFSAESSSLDPAFDYITIDSASGYMVHYIKPSDPEEDHDQRILGNLLTDEFTFQANPENTQELELKISANDKQQNFFVESQIALPNLILYNSSIAGSIGDGIKFNNAAPANLPWKPGTGGSGGTEVSLVTLYIIPPQSTNIRILTDYGTKYTPNDDNTSDNLVDISHIGDDFAGVKAFKFEYLEAGAGKSFDFDFEEWNTNSKKWQNHSKNLKVDLSEKTETILIYTSS
ncbi:MAG: prepilin-type N-terminal cleavage/methylation domain-containing protein [Bacillota bacterium]|nr:prepilin-type N-terminal cleavage/methylation domain-containing protein [Bacillota bacterium]MDW7678557.1 prepilin-type N-terminal cleavage/methylation domain-containing protein [Bacillota bacterium]